MRIGIFGSHDDPQCQSVRATLVRMGAGVVLVEHRALDDGHACSFDGATFRYRGDPLDDVRAWYLRTAASPLAPAFQSGDRWLLFDDWYVEYMQRRERAGYVLSWLTTLHHAGIPVVNPPHLGSIAQLKAYQLAAARHVGLETPRTLITNDPDVARRFVRQVGEVVHKPSMGGGLARVLTDEDVDRLDRIITAPVTFQERVRGMSVRVTAVGESLVSVVGIPSEHVDYRDDPTYSGGGQVYEPVHLPPDIPDKCRALMAECGLLFSGIDFIQRADGSVVFLEANSSPIYLDIERKTGDRITEALCNHLLRLAHEPAGYRRAVDAARVSRSFASYALPFDPLQSVGGPGDSARAATAAPTPAKAPPARARRATPSRRR